MNEIERLVKRNKICNLYKQDIVDLWRSIIMKLVTVFLLTPNTLLTSITLFALHQMDVTHPCAIAILDLRLWCVDDAVALKEYIGEVLGTLLKANVICVKLVQK